jgi:fructokinase
VSSADHAADGRVTLVAGEALYDLVVEGDDTLRGHPGGGPFNTARTIARLEQPVAYLGRLSTDRFGTTLERMLAADGVELGAVVRTDDPTTLALAEMDPAGSARWSFYEQGTAAPGLTPQDALDALTRLPREVGILHVGTLGLILAPVATALEVVVESLADRALIAVDPNCRPWVIRDPVGYRGRLRRVLRNSHLVKVSDEDLAWLDPGRPPLEAARALLELGPSVVLVTRGREGAVVVCADGDFGVPAPAVDVVDTIGAGDAFGAGFLAWWSSRNLDRDALGDTDRVLEATRFAALVAARTCARAGASPPRLNELGG